ncbi:MAG: hypothetical protein ACFCBW_08790, partial [Candidatus Competibacterales bacterium]
IRHRKNALFYKTQAGADAGDRITSIIATCERAGVNALDYLTQVQRYRHEVKAHPSAWLPWTYQASLSARQGEKTLRSRAENHLTLSRR